MILTEIGEIGVSVDGSMHVLRPSLYAMTQIGSPKEIVRIYASVMSDQPHADQIKDALIVLYACSPDEVGDLFGGLDANERGVSLSEGRVPFEHAVILAQDLIRHGVTGGLEELPRNEADGPEFIEDFDARMHASIAMAHLGLSSEQAWRMTMTELVGAMRVKFPQASVPGANAPNIDEVEETLEWHDKVLTARAAKKS